ncbi:MAG: hypothetical protein P8L37_02440 [Phycisphaerales bacterium]|nr:hypothetical protein [Phycisphaerales bacterium]
MSESSHGPAQGIVVNREDAVRFDAALNWAVDYRGDVTLLISEGRELECYVFDRFSDAEDELRCMVKGEEDRCVVPVDSIQELRFSGKDTAAGKTFDRWIERYVQQKLAGKEASIESESLEGG